MRDARREPLVPIDHDRIVDGFGQLDGCVSYVPFDTYCGICDESCHVTPRMQKYILEENGVPVKSLQRGAVFCERSVWAALGVYWPTDWGLDPRWLAIVNGVPQVATVVLAVVALRRAWEEPGVVRRRRGGLAEAGGLT